MGRALVPALVGAGHRVRILARGPGSVPPGSPSVRALPVDLTEGRGLRTALQGAQIGYYLVHSMGGGAHISEFADRDRRAARNFVEAAEAEGMERILYVGGLGEATDRLSPHLQSRREVARILGSRSVKLTELRAAIIVGPGGSSFEMMIQLVEKLPVMICPRWVNSRCQPIARMDLIQYLIRALGVPETIGAAFDVGGPEVWTYRQMLEAAGEALGRRPRIWVVPVLTPSLSSHWVGFITEVPAAVARPLVEGIVTDVVTREDRIRRLIPQQLTPFRAALTEALHERSVAARRGF
ncbi:MAG: NAD(P)H-binding protein [Thermoplasmata archaeon]